jgi:hypothetical protein
MTEETKKEAPENDLADFARDLARQTGLNSFFAALATPENQAAILKVARHAKDRLTETVGEIRKDAEVALLEARLAALRKDRQP